MQPEIIEREAFSVLGVLTRLAPEEQDEQSFKSIWIEFEARLEEIRRHSIEGAFYGLSFPTGQPGTVDYLAAMAVSLPAEVPQGLIAREVPASRYAVFECELRAIGETYRFIFSEWLPGAGVRPGPAAPVFEQYPPEGQESLPVRIHVPIEKGD